MTPIEAEAYYDQVRHDLIPLIPAGARRMLEVGCGSGGTGAWAKRVLNLEHVVGIEIVDSVGTVAASRLDQVLIGDAEAMEIPFPNGYFDCILCGDVLEHTRDPWALLRKLRPLLADNGAIVASLPNIRHLMPVLKIIFDRLEYEEYGVFDRTHLRFFTLHTMRHLFESTGFHIERIAWNKSTSWKFKLAAISSLGLLRSMAIFQYHFVVRKTGR